MGRKMDGTGRMDKKKDVRKVGNDRQKKVWKDLNKDG
jgi:hypothetical protein